MTDVISCRCFDFLNTTLRLVPYPKGVTSLTTRSKTPLLPCQRAVMLSMTHMLCSKDDAGLASDKASRSAPHERVF